VTAVVGSPRLRAGDPLRFLEALCLVFLLATAAEHSLAVQTMLRRWRPRVDAGGVDVLATLETLATLNTDVRRVGKVDQLLQLSGKVFLLAANAMYAVLLYINLTLQVPATFVRDPTVADTGGGIVGDAVRERWRHSEVDTVRPRVRESVAGDPLRQTLGENPNPNPNPNPVHQPHAAGAGLLRGVRPPVRRRALPALVKARRRHGWLLALWRRRDGCRVGRRRSASAALGCQRRRTRAAQPAGNHRAAGAAGLALQPLPVARFAGECRLVRFRARHEALENQASELGSRMSA
jgi:hypothetical protein